MARTEWLRTFVSACQAGSISEAARLRNVSQPAATGHVRSLEAAVGTALFVRRRDGVEPTEAGRRLYAEVVDPLDRLAAVLTGLDAGAVAVPTTPVRIGASPEVFAGLVVPHLGPVSPRVDAVFGTDDELHTRFGRDEIDLVITPVPLARRWTVTDLVGSDRYALVSSTAGALRPVADLRDLARRLGTARWVSYSNDLPKTRRFWKQHLGRAFDAEVRLVAPDLRVVLAAVEAGVGASLLPTMVCGPALERGSVFEVFPVRDLVDPRPLWATTRAAVAARADVEALREALRRAAD
ncbi:MAG: LysR family transcriptional regulator [Acidimicrobiales bacterium]